MHAPFLGSTAEPAPPDQSPPPDYRVYPSRALHQLAILCFLVLGNAVIWVAFSSITRETAAAYGVSSAWVNLVALSFQIMFLPGTMLGYGVMRQHGLRATLVAGGGLTTVGAAVRLGSAYLPASPPPPYGADYALLLLGTCLAALAQPMLLNLPTDLAGQWFAVRQRDLVTSLAFMCSPLGNAVGVALAPAFVATGDDPAAAKAGLRTFLLVQFVVVAATTLWAWQGVRDRPPTPPSHSAALHVHNTRDRNTHHAPRRTWRHVARDIGRELGRCLVHNGPFRLLFVCFGVGLGFFNALLTLVGQLLVPCGYTDTQAGVLGGVFLGAGLVGAVLAGVLLDKTHAYRRCLQAGFLGAWGAALLFVCALRPDNFPLLAASFALLGFLMLPLLPVAIDNGVEITYPDGVPEFFSSGLLLCAGNLAGLPLAALFSAVIDGYHGSCRTVLKPAAIFVLCVTTACAFPTLAYRPARFGRWEAEKNRQGRQGGEEDFERI